MVEELVGAQQRGDHGVAPARDRREAHRRRPAPTRADQSSAEPLSLCVVGPRERLNCISNPPTLSVRFGIAITPALFTSASVDRDQGAISPWRDGILLLCPVWRQTKRGF